MTAPEAIYSDAVATLAEQGNLRRIPVGERCPGIVDFSANDYLGLGADPALQAEFMASTEHRAIPMTSSAARLLSGRQEEYRSLEELLTQLYGRPALLFNSGYHANAGLVSALASVPRTFIAADRLAHASIIDGITLSRAPFGRWRHNDTAHLERMIEDKEGDFDRILVIAESIYSMDGDTAPLDELVTLKRRHPKVMLYIDEAHAFGVSGPRGLGLCRGLEGYDDVDIIVGTFGKACASMGAFAVMSESLREYAVNRSRSFIFSTAFSPMQAAWTRFVIEKMIAMDDRRAHLHHLGQLLGNQLSAPASHILPFMVGDPRRAVELSAELLERGFKVLPIRTPTVPPGTDRLRISLSAAMSEADVKALAAALKSIVKE